MWTSSNTQVTNEDEMNDGINSTTTDLVNNINDCTVFGMDVETNQNFDNNPPKNTHLLYEGQTVENFVNEFDGFYNEMMTKMKTLRHPPIMKSRMMKAETTTIIDDESKLFKNMKNTPDIQKKLNFIRKLDEDIKETISTYKNEKEERMETQLQMCNEIQKHTISSERETGTFLDLCQFEYANSIQDAEDAQRDNEEPNEETKKLTSYKGFVKRNKLLAKEGLLASFSLTDEEKCKLEEILSVEEEDNLEDADQKTKLSFLLKDNDNVDDNNEDTSDGNTYAICASDRKRLKEIDEQLEKYQNDEAILCCPSSASKNYENTIISEYMLQKELKKIDDRLEMLRRAEEEQVKELDVILERLDENRESKGY